MLDQPGPEVAKPRPTEEGPASAFLRVREIDWVAANPLAFAILDLFPVSPGHTLVVTRRVVASWFDATPAERAALLDLVDVVRQRLDVSHRPAGYNVGINIGEAAGQTIAHLHVHVIPRYRGDVDDPRGGLRHVIPGKGNYLRAAAHPLVTGGAGDPFLRHIGPLFARARDVAVLAAFVQDSGLELLREPVFGALGRGAHVRLLTGDYLDITQAAALRRLLDWMDGWAAHETSSDEPRGHGIFETRVVETGGAISSFHPKSWRFEGDGFGQAFVGSSNVSRTALREGIEWNLCADRLVDPVAYREITTAFEHWWTVARPLTDAWVAGYEARARREALRLPPGEAEPEPLEIPPPPHVLQVPALDALAETRISGRHRALVVLATGLGKTWLAAFDIEAVRRERGRMPRVLFLAHRSELLEQAARLFRCMFREARFSWFAGERGDLGGDLVFASVQKLSTPASLDRLVTEIAPVLDYVVVDEVHHATAPSYRRILDRLERPFVLGLTATPDRADEADVVGLFDDNLVYRADLGVGIVEGLLAPFAYFGLRDVVDYANIPWRNRRFDPEVLAGAVQTHVRMERLWEAWAGHPARRSLVFCCSIAHAEFVREWLAGRGVRVAAVHSAPDSTDRGPALEALERGELDAICSVDLFNEGVDLPTVDRVVMLRPTESPVVFLQQLGRGLRRAAGKERLTVIDFVGNHRVFLDRVRLLVSLGPVAVSLREFLVDGRAPTLPVGCSVDVEFEAIDMLRRLLPAGATEVQRAYRELAASRVERPTAGELYRLGYRPGTLRGAHGSWFEFVRDEGDLMDRERRVLERALPWLREVETTRMTKSFKMVVLQVLLEREALGTGLTLDEMASLAHAYLLRLPDLLRDIEGVTELPDPRAPDPARWRTYWRENPIEAWTVGGNTERRWFRLDSDRLVSEVPECPGDEETLAAMTRELVDYRLAMYLASTRLAAAGDALECVVLSNQRDPILKLPSRAQRPDMPSGEVDVRLPDGVMWRFRFMKEFCNVAHPAGRHANALPDLLRTWFGPGAGRPGTGFRVRFSRSPDGWWVEPGRGQVVQPLSRGRVVGFPSLRAAAGAAVAAPGFDAPESETVRLPVEGAGRERFCVRAVGDSMDGGATPIRDADWLVMRWARASSLASLQGRVALIEIRSGETLAHQVKRVVREGGHWLLKSDNPARPSIEATTHAIPVAVLEQVVRPEDLAPPVGEKLRDEQLASAFGLSGPAVDGRTDGHLFLRVTQRGLFVAPDRLRWTVPDRREGETAFLMTRASDAETWRYGGVARWSEAEGLWVYPALDFATWRALGTGRGASRSLSHGALDAARTMVQVTLEQVGTGSWIESGGRRFRVVGEASEGGLRIDGGPQGFAERTVSLTDLAWVLVARDDVASHGGALDEARVNRVRYLDGTPKEATRWIDTGWALRLVSR
jgi:superfamily II DNA or RNA helicase/diadenosine tetraphosphate (Ap4A) HIT family hydrolase